MKKSRHILTSAIIAAALAIVFTRCGTQAAEIVKLWDFTHGAHDWPARYAFDFFSVSQ